MRQLRRYERLQLTATAILALGVTMTRAQEIEKRLTEQFGIRIFDLKELEKNGATRIGTHRWLCRDNSCLDVHPVTGGSHPGGFVVNAVG